MPVAIVLVLVGFITLAVGVFSATVAWVYVSIAATAMAGVVLFGVHRSGRSGPATVGPAPVAGAAGTGPPDARPAAGPADAEPPDARPSAGPADAPEPGGVEDA